jgi:ketosteroid isomerase-like protein
MEFIIMRRIAFAISVIVGMSPPAFAQKAEIEVANAKWIEFFNKGDFASLGSLYTADATAFPPGSAMVRGDAAIGAMFKRFSEEVGDPKLATLDVKSLGPSAAQEIGTKSIGLDPRVFGTHSVRRTKVTLIYRRTGNLRAVQLLLGHTKIESTVRYLGIEVDDALAITEQVDV